MPRDPYECYGNVIIETRFNMVLEYEEAPSIKRLLNKAYEEGRREGIAQAMEILREEKEGAQTVLNIPHLTDSARANALGWADAVKGAMIALRKLRVRYV